MTTKFMILGSLASSLVNFRGKLIEALCEQGCAVHAVAPALSRELSTFQKLSAQGVDCHDVVLARTGLNPLADLVFFQRLTQLMRIVRPHYFLAYTIKPVIWGLIAAKAVRIPNRVALISGLGYAFTGEVKGRRAAIQCIALWLYRFALKRATLIFFQNPDDKADFERFDLLPEGVPVVVVNGSGVDTDFFVPTEFPPTPIRFLLIARLLGDKGIKEYVAAAAKVKEQHPNVEFLLVGGLDPNPDGISEQEVQNWQRTGNVSWFGPIPDVRSAIANSHVYVLPSYREGMPRTVLEAMAMARPVITTDAPGCKETVVDGDNGFLVPVKSVEALVAAMEKFILKPELAARMGQRSREIAVEKYDVHKVNAVMLKEMGIA